LDKFGSRCFVGDPDVNAKIVELGALLQLLGAKQEMNRLPSYDTWHRSAASTDNYSLSDQHLGVPSSDFSEPEISLLIYMSNYQTNLVDMAE
jgi:hypothetical protein